MFGLSESSWQTITNILIEPLKKQGAKIWIFGSRARGDHKKYSDLDIFLTGVTRDRIEIILHPFKPLNNETGELGQDIAPTVQM